MARAGRWFGSIRMSLWICRLYENTNSCWSSYSSYSSFSDSKFIISSFLEIHWSIFQDNLASTFSQVSSSSSFELVWHQHLLASRTIIPALFLIWPAENAQLLCYGLFHRVKIAMETLDEWLNQNYDNSGRVLFQFWRFSSLQGQEFIGDCWQTLMVLKVCELACLQSDSFIQSFVILLQILLSNHILQEVIQGFWEVCAYWWRRWSPCICKNSHEHQFSASLWVQNLLLQLYWSQNWSLHGKQLLSEP